MRCNPGSQEALVPDQTQQLVKPEPKGYVAKAVIELAGAIVFGLLGILIVRIGKPPDAVPTLHDPDLSAFAVALSAQLHWQHGIVEVLVVVLFAIAGFWIGSWLAGLSTHARVHAIDTWAGNATPIINGIRSNTAATVAANAASSAIEKLAIDFGCQHPVQLNQDWAQAIAAGHLTVFDMSDVFVTDAEMIGSHQKSNGAIISTVLTADESGQSNDSDAFRQYIQAALAAASNGIEFYRFYLIQTLDAATDPNSPVVKQIARMQDDVNRENVQSQFKLFVVTQTFLKERGIPPFDLVAFGNRCISFGREEKVGSKLIGAEYYQIGDAPDGQKKRYLELKEWLKKCNNGACPQGILTAEQYLKLGGRK
jgi:hypothetical protein